MEFTPEREYTSGDYMGGAYPGEHYDVVSSESEIH